MTSVVTTILFIFILFLTGKIFEGSKRVLMLFIQIVLKILNLFGCQISLSEPTIYTSRRFNKTFEDIRVVKKSKHNNKMVPSINALALVMLLLCASVVVTNIIYNGWASTWIYENIDIIRYVVVSKESMSTILIASMFSIMSFSLAKLCSQWKETKKYRVAKREIKIRKRVLSTMTSKQLLDAAKEKDQARMSELRREDSDNIE